MPELLRRTGWIKLFRSEATLGSAVGDLERAGQYGVAGEVLDTAAIAAREPHLTGDFSGAIHFRHRASCRTPAAWPRPIRRCSAARARRYLVGDARTLEQSGGRWRVATLEGTITARDVVVAMGPWSDQILRRSAIRSRFKVKRGYHLHVKPRGNAVLDHPVLDTDQGYLLAPMNRGIRLTTGAEFAHRDAPPTPVQVEQALPRAHRLFPLGEPADTKPWMGARPCLPDMLPVIGKARAIAGCGSISATSTTA